MIGACKGLLKAKQKEKTMVMIFENRKSNKHYEFKYDGNAVKVVDSFKYLGV